MYLLVVKILDFIGIGNDKNDTVLLMIMIEVYFLSVKLWWEYLNKKIDRQRVFDRKDLYCLSTKMAIK